MRLITLACGVAGTLLAINAVAQTAPAPVHEMHDRAILQEEQPSRFFGLSGGKFVTSSSSAAVDTFYYYGFENGFDGWTFDTINPSDTLIWEYRDGSDVALRFMGDYASPTVANGFAFFAYADRITESGTVDPGAPPYPVLNQTMSSPWIDISATSGLSAIALEFYSTYRALNDKSLTVNFSSPDVQGTTFVPYEQDQPNNTATARGVEVIRIPNEFIGTDSLQVSFTYNAGFYGWAIDDINIVELPSVIVGIDPNFFAAAPSYQTPISQRDSLVFVTDVNNSGGEAQNLRLALTVNEIVDNMLGRQLFTDTLEYGIVPPDTLIQNRVYPGRVAMPEEVGLYQTTYRLVGDNIDDDIDSDDNVFGYTFEMTETEFAKSEGFSATNRPAGDANQEFALGAIYYVPNNADSDFQIDSIGMVVGWEGLADNAGEWPTVELTTFGFYGDLDGDGNVDFDFGAGTDEEIVELEVREYELDPSDPIFGGLTDNILIVTPPSEDDGPVVLDNEFIGFVVQARTFPSTDATVNTNDDLFLGLGTTDGYGGYNLANDSLGLARSATIILSPNGYSYGFFGGVSPYNPAWVSREVSTAYEALSPDAFTVSPNPATDFIQVNFDLGETNDVAFKLINSLGQQIRSYSRKGVEAGTIEITTNGLANGLYSIQAVTADSKSHTKQVLVER